MTGQETSNKSIFIFVTGGVVSSLGKGITAASLGVVLKSQGYSVAIQKFDPYLNLDPGTMSPYQHGEVFVTEDGCETDLDLGHYERFLDENVTRLNNITSGMIYQRVLNKERRGDYLGNTVQIIPHVTNEIKDQIMAPLQNKHYDVILVEVGGTIGDIESLPFIEAIRQFQFNNRETTLHMHLTLVPYLTTSGEFKTKPTQHSVKELRSIGISPDIIVCRSLMPLTKTIKDKIALFCDVAPDSVISAVDVDSIYDVPLVLQQEGLDKVILSKLNLEMRDGDMADWKNYVRVLHDADLDTIKIAIVGKYVNYSDCYISVVEALKHACVDEKARLHVQWVDSEGLSNENVADLLSGVDGILVPGGFGERGVEGKILASKYARDHNIPYLGLCLGMHVAAIDIARHILNLNEAHSTEFNQDTSTPVINLLEEQEGIKEKGGTMRLGSYPCKIKEGSLMHRLYQSPNVDERHRHRFEFNNDYRDQFESSGVCFSGTSPDNSLIEVLELESHPFFIACQFHPEFKSRPNKSHPLFAGLVAAAQTQLSKKTEQCQSKNSNA